MVDIDKEGGLQVIVKELLDADLLKGNTLTCTCETLKEQVERLQPKKPDGEVIYTLKKPFKKTGGLNEKEIIFIDFGSSTYDSSSNIGSRTAN